MLPVAARRTLAGLIVAVCAPETGEGTERADALERVEAYVAGLPPGSRTVLLIALRAFDHGARLYAPARGRRYADLPPATAARYLAALMDSRAEAARGLATVLRSIVALCYYDVPAVRSRLGYDPEPHIAAVAGRRDARHGAAVRAGEAAVLAEPGLVAPASPVGPPAQRRPASDPPMGVVTGEGGDLELDCAVAIVGSGAGGATMAAELADAGVDVVMIEEGGYHPTESFTTDTVRALSTLYRANGAQTIAGRPPIGFLEGRCVGGSTVVNGGMCWRTPDEVLERWSREEAVAGVSPTEMARYFEYAERRLSIEVQDAESIGRDAQLLAEGAEALGWSTVRSRRNQLHCGGCDNCLAGCPTGAKRSMLVTNVPRALSRGARLVTGCRVGRIVREGRRVTGLTGRFADGGRLTVRAPVVVAAAGGVQTPALLARSGFRSSSGRLRRDLTVHPSAALMALFDEEVRGWQGVHQAYQVDEFADQGILVTASTLPPALAAANLPQRGRALVDTMAGYNRMVAAGCLVEDSTTGRVHHLPGGGAVATYRLAAADGERVIRGLGHAAELMFAAGARRVQLPFETARQAMDADATRRFLRSAPPHRALRLFTVHAMGTARMSDDPTRGVVSSFGEFHGAHGLVVADAGLLPSPVGVNPMETVVALAARNAERLVADRRRHAI